MCLDCRGRVWINRRACVWIIEDVSGLQTISAIQVLTDNHPSSQRSFPSFRPASNERGSFRSGLLRHASILNTYHSMLNGKKTGKRTRTKSPPWMMKLRTIRWTGQSLYPWGMPFLRTSPVHSCRKFSAVFGQRSAHSSNCIRPAATPPMVISTASTQNGYWTLWCWENNPHHTRKPSSGQRFFFSRNVGHREKCLFPLLKKIIFGSKSPKNVLFNFENRSTAS